MTRRLVVAGSTSGAGQEYTSPTAWSQTLPIKRPITMAKNSMKLELTAIAHGDNVAVGF